MDDEDPALQFFPDGNVDLYAVLGVNKDATQEQIKKAYKKLALKFHPDKVLSNANQQETIAQFQKIGFSYAVLSDEVRRKKYDSTGSTRELGLGEGEDFDWNEYFKTLWTGEVSRKTLDDFKKKYQNSEEEKEDIVQAYQSSQGDLEGIFASVPCSEFLADEERIIAIVNQAIQQGQLTSTPGWEKSSKDKKARNKLRQKAKTEAKEAEALAKEMGVHDDLFGDGAAAAKKEAKGKDEGEEDFSALQALMQRKQQNRANAFDDMIAKLEAKPSDEEFDRIQREMLDKKRKGPDAPAKAKRTRK